MDKLLYGMPCVIAQQIKKQKKTSKYKLINWFYKKIYGYEYESILPEGIDMTYVDGKLIFRNIEIYNYIKNAHQKNIKNQKNISEDMV